MLKGDKIYTAIQDIDETLKILDLDVKYIKKINTNHSYDYHMPYYHNYLQGLNCLFDEFKYLNESGALSTNYLDMISELSDFHKNVKHKDLSEVYVKAIEILKAYRQTLEVN